MFNVRIIIICISVFQYGFIYPGRLAGPVLRGLLEPSQLRMSAPAHVLPSPPLPRLGPGAPSPQPSGPFPPPTAVWAWSWWYEGRTGEGAQGREQKPKDESQSLRYSRSWRQLETHYGEKMRCWGRRGGGAVFTSGCSSANVEKYVVFLLPLQGNTSAALLLRRKRAVLRMSFLLLASCRLTPSWWRSSSRSWTRWGCFPSFY